MKATLTFDLNDSDERAEHKRAIQATDAYLVLWDLDQELRQKLKYSELTGEREIAYSEIREKLHDLLSNYGVNLDDLT